MKAKLIKNDIGYHLWLNPETKEQEHIASDNPVIDNWGVDLRKYKLSKQNCDDIFGVVDVDDLAYKHRRAYQDSFEGMNECIMKDAMHQQVGFVAGFSKAIELNKDKVFTLEDIKKAIEYGIQSALHAIPGVTSTQSILENFIQQPTEIEVEIKMEEYPELPYYKGSQPKLDSEGCLILKKI
jgi:hypothetical protein